MFTAMALDGETFVVYRCEDDLEPGSLRWAIRQANANEGRDDIWIPPGYCDRRPIQLRSSLPVITDETGLGGKAVIDGSLAGTYPFKGWRLDATVRVESPYVDPESSNNRVSIALKPRRRATAR